MIRITALILLVLSFTTYSEGVLDSIVDGKWLRVPTLGQYPARGVDIHPVCDTAGNMYTIGGCTYGNVASGTHNSDVYRFDLKTGRTYQIYSTATNPFPIFSCQMGLAYDKTRNCIWFSWGDLYTSTRGLYKYQCPSGPITKVTDTLMGMGRYGCSYLYYDEVNDQLVGATALGLAIRKLQTGDTDQVAYPPNLISNGYEIPSCLDTKRGLFIMSQWGSCWCGSEKNPSDPGPILNTVWCYNLSTKAWQTKAPAVTPGTNFGSEMSYDVKADKCVYFGSGRLGYGLPELWLYDYDSNTWTKVDRGARTFNSANPSASTWPALRFKHGWTYSEKLDVHVNWGGYNYFATEAGITLDPAVIDFNNNADQPLWMYRIGSSSSTSEASESAGKNISISVSPNPLKVNSNIVFNLPEAGSISLEVFDINGRLVNTLKKGFLKSGHHRVVWNATDKFNRTVTGGMYVIKLSDGKSVLTAKAILSL